MRFYLSLHIGRRQQFITAISVRANLGYILCVVRYAFSYNILCMYKHVVLALLWLKQHHLIVPRAPAHPSTKQRSGSPSYFPVSKKLYGSSIRITFSNFGTKMFVEDIMSGCALTRGLNHKDRGSQRHLIT